MKAVLLLGLIVSVFYCDCNTMYSDKPAFSAFDFSYNDVFSSCFSIKFTQGDTVYVVQHFPKYSGSGLKFKQVYMGILKHDDRQRLDTLIQNIDFFRLEDSYVERVQDGLDYQFFIQNDTQDKTIRVHSEHAPPALNTLASCIAGVKARLKLVEVDTVVQFGSLKQFLPTAVPPPPVEFIPRSKRVKHYST